MQVAAVPPIRVLLRLDRSRAIHPFPLEPDLPELPRRKSEERLKGCKVSARSSVRQRPEAVCSPEALTIQASQPTLLRIAKVLHMHESTPRKTSVAAKYNRHFRVPKVGVETCAEEQTSFDSNELNIDLEGLLERKKVKCVRVQNIVAEEVMQRKSVSTPRQSIKSTRREQSPLTPSFPPKSPAYPHEACLRSSQPHRFPIDQNPYLRIRWLQKQKLGLRRLVL